MGKYLTIWEADDSKIPVDPEERKLAWLGAIEMERMNMNDGVTKDWGVFLGQTKGFSISEGSKEDVINSTLKFIPYFKFQIYPIASIDDIEKAIKAM
jgi:hypothetical protein